jgi:hypothetical protein
MKSIFYKIILLLIVFMGIQSCELEESKNYETINPSIFPSNSDDVSAMVIAAAYNVFKNDSYGGMFNIANGVLVVSDLMSDYGECSWRQWVPILYGRWILGNSYTDNQYRFSKYLSDMTMTISRIQDVDMNESLKERYIAELRCGRGWLAFCMYDLFGAIPIADIKTLKNPLEEKILPRLSEEEMKTYIETELTEAAKLLPYSYKKGDPDYGRFTKGLANTVLLKFYMMTKQWTKAEAIGRELTKSAYGYALVPKYKNIFTLANEKNAETIWANNELRGYQVQLWMPHVIPPGYPTSPSNVVKWGGFKISWSFFHTFDPNDERLEVIISKYQGTDGVYHSEEIDVPNSGRLKYGAAPLKYEIDPGTSGEDSEIDWIIYRYADVLTLLSEAIVRNGNKVTQEAVDLLNQIRIRAGLEAYPISSFTGVDDFLDKLLLERGHELFFEGVRRQDLIRYGKYVSAMKEKCQKAGETTLINSHMERYPLPQSVIDEGKGLIEQNPGY